MYDPADPDYRGRTERLFTAAPHVQALGIRPGAIGPGWCEALLDVAPRHLQQTGVVHAGVVATLADHTAGAAATTLLAADQFVLTVEFKIHLLRAAQGPQLWCRAQVLKPGRTLFVAESEVFTRGQAETTLVAKASVTLVVRPPCT